MAAEGRDLAELGRLVRAARQRLKLTIAETSRRTGDVVLPVHLTRLEKGELGARLEKLDALALALEVSREEHGAIRRAAGYAEEGALDSGSIVKRVEGLEDKIEDVADRLQDVEFKLDELIDRLGS